MSPRENLAFSHIISLLSPQNLASNHTSAQTEGKPVLAYFKEKSASYRSTSGENFWTKEGGEGAAINASITAKNYYSKDYVRVHKLKDATEKAPQKRSFALVLTRFEKIMGKPLQPAEVDELWNRFGQPIHDISTQCELKPGDTAVNFSQFVDDALNLTNFKMLLTEKATFPTIDWQGLGKILKTYAIRDGIDTWKMFEMSWGTIDDKNIRLKDDLKNRWTRYNLIPASLLSVRTNNLENTELTERIGQSYVKLLTRKVEMSDSDTVAYLDPEASSMKYFLDAFGGFLATFEKQEPTPAVIAATALVYDTITNKLSKWNNPKNEYHKDCQAQLGRIKTWIDVFSSR